VHEYKAHFVKNGTFNFTINFLYKVKEETDQLIKEGKFDPNATRQTPLENNEHPFPGCNSIAMNLLSTLTYMKSE
jgi:hypothetical protein